MDAETPSKDVLVLTDSPDRYDADMRRLGLAPRYAPSVSLMLEHLVDHPASGFVLEVGKVMRAPDPGRSQMFQLAKVFPVLRVLRRGLGQEVVYLEGLEGFQAQVQAFAPREVRHCGRAPVLLQGVLAPADGGGFPGGPVQARILDISPGGGFVSCQGGVDPEECVRLSIQDIEDPTPILSSIRWRRGEGRRDWVGFGLRFLDIRPGQLRELLSRFLAPLGRADDLAAGASCP